MNIKKSVLLYLMIYVVLQLQAQNLKKYNLQSDHLATRWDEAIPLGNGMLGALIWQKDNTLRLSLDRADLWDERKAFEWEQHNFSWVQQQVNNKTYEAVQQWGDAPYDVSPYPTKLPAAAVSFDLSVLGKAVSNILDIRRAENTIIFDNANTFRCYIHATEPIGYFEIRAKQIDKLIPQLLPHQYEAKGNGATSVSVVEGQHLARLGYKQGLLKNSAQRQLLHQPTYENNYYEVELEWRRSGKDKLIGMWTVSNNRKADVSKKMNKKSEQALENSHLSWWNKYWSQSSVSLPDTLLQRQYYLDMYKLGAVARKAAPAITLQAVWTADNGGLPPWKGDFHNDLNTQLSYWPAYTGNRLAEAETYTDWLWRIRETNVDYTKRYFGVEGLNIPGVLTLNGLPMGGWIQYSLSPTVSAWTAQHFYWQWKYSMDDVFLKERAYPYIIAAATYLKNITELREGKRYLPLSSSPEYNDNSINAWFKDWTNFDLGLARFLFDTAAEVSTATGRKTESENWKKIASQLPDYAADDSGMLMAPGVRMEHSHRHMSPYMAIYPLGRLDINNPQDAKLILNSLRHLEKLGTRAWVGYSFTWMACLYARAKEADLAVSNLQKFAGNFCSTNSFHLNGDQKGGQYSGFTYRPFTLEGNFAFAQGIHELLLQSKSGYVEIFPAVPQSWADVSFTNLLTEGGFVISASKQNGRLKSIQVKANHTGILQLRSDEALKTKNGKPLVKNQNTYTISLKADESIELLPAAL